MGKPANKRRESDNEATAIARQIRTGGQKLNAVAQLIRGKDVNRALTDLDFCHRRVSNDVKKVLQAAIANAENNHGLDVDRLFVSRAVVGKAIVMKRFRARARGRGASIQKPFSRLTITVKEKEA